MRTNTVDWSSAEVITRKCHKLLEELMKWQKFTHQKDLENPGMVMPISRVKGFSNDSMVIVEAIQLRDYLNQIIERSKNANTVS